jgi:hypothetical protein
MTWNPHYYQTIPTTYAYPPTSYTQPSQPQAGYYVAPTQSFTGAMGYVAQPGAEVASYAYAETQDVGEAREPFRRHVGDGRAAR